MKKSVDTPAKMLGFLWGSIPIFYLVPGQAMVAQLIILAISLAISSDMSSWRIPRRIGYLIAFVLAFIVVSAISELGGVPSMMEYLKYFVFISQLAILSTLVKVRDLHTFFISFFVATSAVSVIHILFVVSGSISSNYGRYMFIGNSHPNLGGEIYAMAAILGAIFVKKKSNFVLGMTAILASAYLMQTRSGMIVSVIPLISRVLLENNSGGLNAKSVAMGGVALGVIVAVALSIPQVVEVLVNNILLLNDPFRGSDTGLVTGRDGHWLVALEAFNAAPILGQGLSYYSGDGILGAHNAIFYSLSMFGMVGALFWVLVIGCTFSIYRVSKRLFYYLLPIWILLLLNDRFINLNPYPLLYFFSLFRLSDPAIKKMSNLYWLGAPAGRRKPLLHSSLLHDRKCSTQ